MINDLLQHRGPRQELHHPLHVNIPVKDDRPTLKSPDACVVLLNESQLVTKGCFGIIGDYEI